MALHYPPDTEYRSLLLHENDFDFPDDPKFTPGAQWSSKITERRGIQLSHGVAQMLQLWPALLSNVLRTFVLILVACFVFVLAVSSISHLYVARLDEASRGYSQLAYCKRDNGPFLHKTVNLFELRNLN